MGTHLKVLGKSYPMNTNLIGFRWFSKIVAFLCFGQKYSLSIGRVKMQYVMISITLNWSLLERYVLIPSTKQMSKTFDIVLHFLKLYPLRYNISTKFSGHK